MRTVLSRLGKLASNAAAMRTSLMQSPSMTEPTHDERIGAPPQLDESKIKPWRPARRDRFIRPLYPREGFPAPATLLPRQPIPPGWRQAPRMFLQRTCDRGHRDRDTPTVRG